jgi:glycosyltransferase involved in cell wall biosynthesis/SAM-dependent methyltransferase
MKNSGSLIEEHSARFVFLQGGSKRLPNRVALPVIAMVTDDFFPATTGVGVHVQKVAPELARRGHKVVVLTSRLPGQPAEETWNGVKVYRFFSVPLFGHYQALPSGRAIRRILTENNVVRVHFHYISFMMLRVLNVARSLSIRTVYTAHMTVDHLTQPVLLRPLRGLFKRILQKTGNRFDDIICVSSKQMAQMKTVHPQAQVTFLSNPIDFDGEDVSASNQPHKFVVFYAGRLEPEKNVGYLLHSFRLLLDRRPDAELWIAGRGFQEGELRRHVQSLGLLEKVSFLGHVRHEKLPGLYASADVFVLPSLVETQGMVALEAIRFRRPVIVTNRIVSAHELVEDGVTGYIVNPDSASDLADKLVILYDNPVRRRLMGEAGFRRFSFETSEQVVTKLLKVYERQDHAPAPTSVKNPCSVCGEKDRPVETQFVRCNVRQFRDQKFRVWRCSHCGSLNTEKVKDLAVYYKGYPLHNARLNFFNRVWYGIFLKRLVRAGLTKDDRILDYGCGQGLFLEYLKKRGYMNGFGFDPHVERYQAPSVLEQNYDWVIGMDVIEHDVNPGAFVSRMSSLLKSTGRLCLQTPNADGVVLSKSEEYLHTLHVPYHVQVFSYDGLVDQCRKAGLVPISSTSRYFVDSWQPGTSWAFIQSLLQAGGNDFDVAFEKPRLSLFIKYPSLLFKLFFGYFMYPKKKRSNDGDLQTGFKFPELDGKTSWKYSRGSFGACSRKSHDHRLVAQGPWKTGYPPLGKISGQGLPSWPV